MLHFGLSLGLGISQSVLNLGSIEEQAAPRIHPPPLQHIYTLFSLQSMLTRIDR